MHGSLYVLSIISYLSRGKCSYVKRFGALNADVYFDDLERWTVEMATEVRLRAELLFFPCISEVDGNEM